MKKTLLSLMVLGLLSSVSIAASSENCTKVPSGPDCGCKKQNNCIQKKNDCKNSCAEKKDCDPKSVEEKCNKCTIDDDEYCIYNQCYLDKHFRDLKRTLCLSSKQETCIDTIYKNFKSDMETLHSKYRVEKNKLLGMIECDNDCYREQVSVLKELKKEAKEKCKDFRSDIKEQLCKNQYSAYRKFLRQEKRKMKKIIKYGAIYKLPCKDCCGNN